MCFVVVLRCKVTHFWRNRQLSGLLFALRPFFLLVSAQNYSCATCSEVQSYCHTCLPRFVDSCSHALSPMAVLAQDFQAAGQGPYGIDALGVAGVVGKLHVHVEQVFPLAPDDG